jgi:hypothetical protein
MQTGDLAAVKSGSHRVILFDDLVAWLHAQCEPAVGVAEATAEERNAAPPTPRARSTRRPPRGTTRRRSNAAEATLPLAD